MSRVCDAIGCSATVATGKFMCIRHWKMVPIEMQRTINDRYRTTRKDFGFLSDQAYLEACIRAIGKVSQREGKPHGETSYSRLLRGVLKRKTEAV